MYNKLFTKILDSTIWLENDATRLVWITLLACMDEDGYVALSSVGNVAARARVPLESAQQAITALESSDPLDPTQEHEGKRIERVPYGWMILNAGKYRDLIRRETIKEQTRERVAQHRAKRAEVTQRNENVTPSDTDTDTDTDNGSTNVDPSVWAEFVEHRKAIKKPLGKLSAQKNRNILEVLTPEQQRETVDRTIANNWTGLFPGGSKNGTHKQNPGPLSAVDRVRIAVAEREAAMQREEAHDKSIVATYEPDLRPQMDEQPWISG